MKRIHNLSVGDWVQVRSKGEILATLDSQGRLDGMYFMPEMFQYCGQRFQVFKRAHKTCDYSTPYPYRTRRLKDTVHLQTRCDGQAHDDCHAGCLLYWKIQWLKPLGSNGEELVSLSTNSPLHQTVAASSCARCTEAVVSANTKVAESNSDSPTYTCQATHVQDATQYLAWWDVRQYMEDYFSGNVSLGRIIDGLVYSSYYHLAQAGIGLGPVMRWFYDKFHFLWGGTLYPRKPGFIPEGEPTPTTKLNLQPGELVRIKPHLEILKTVDSINRNRGMFWDAELVPYCGKTYRVLSRVTRLIDEKTGKMIEMKNPCIILDTVVCQARYSPCRMLCPKAMYPYWREIWLERVDSQVSDRSHSEDSNLTPVGR